MGEENRLSGKVGLDTTDFKTGITTLNRELRVIKSGFRASAAALGDWGKSADGLEMRVESLTKEIDVQRTKVELVRKEYERVAQEKGKNSRAAQNLEIKLNRETETLNKMERELGDTNDQLEEMKGDADRAAKGVDNLDDEQKQATRSSLSLKGAMSGLATGVKATTTAIIASVKAVVAMTAAVAALAVGVAAYTVGPASDLAETTSKAQTVFADYADGVIENAKRADTALGVSQQQYLDYASALGAALTAGGASIQDATTLSEQAVQHFADLASFHNREVEDMAGAWQSAVRGSYEPIQSVFPFITNEFLKTFGVSNGLIDEQTENLTANQRAIILNAIALDSQLNPALGDFERTSGGLANQQRSLRAQFDNIRAEIGTALLPVVTELVTQINEFLKSDTGRTIIDTIVEGIGNLANLLQNFNLGDFLGNLFGGFAEKRANFANIALDIINGLIGGLTESLPNLLPIAQKILDKLVEFLTTGLPTLIETGVPILLSLIEGILQALPSILEAAIQIIVALAQGLTDSLPMLIPTIIQVVREIVLILTENLPMLIDVAAQLIGALVAGIILALPDILEAAWEIMNSLYNVLGGVNSLKLLWNIGKSLVQGIWEGIQSNVDWFTSRVNSFFSNIVDTVKSSLGIHSPSKLFADEIGKNIPLGVGLGIENAMPALKRQLAGAMAALSGDINLGVNAGTGLGAGHGGSMSVSVGDIIVQVGGTNASPVQVGRAAEKGVLRALRAAGGA